MFAIIAALFATPANAQDRSPQRQFVEASVPQTTAITIYRDPNRSTGDQMNRDWPQGFAMISETRQVTLPAGRSTIRFEGVAEGMVAVSAIVTGLPGGTIEKNRNADLLSPAALVDGTLGNRILVTRTNPATGEEVSEGAVIRTRADGGLVLQTTAGYEAVRCAGIPEALSFDGVPDGLSARPVFSIDTASAAGGTFTVTLSYLAWGFDWEANYVATVHEGGRDKDLRFDLVSWLTLLNDNGQSFPDAELMAVAGRLNVTSDYRRLADPPAARPLRLTCYPLGSTAAGSPIPVFETQNFEAMEDGAIMVSAMRSKESVSVAPAPGSPPPPMVAKEENLGDLKLYRVPEPVTVAAQSLKQIAFLRREDVEGRLLYEVSCDPWQATDDPIAARMLLETTNDEEHGLGVALPNGQMAIFERGPGGELLVGQETLRDYASGQDIEIQLGESQQVFVQCERLTEHNPSEEGAKWSIMRSVLTNANDQAVTLRLELGFPAQWQLNGIRTRLKDGQNIAQITIPAHGTRTLEWRVKRATS